MKHWRIKHRILLLALAPVWVISLLIILLVVYVGTTQIDAALISRGQIITRQLAPASEYGAFSGNSEVLRGLTQAVMREDDAKAVIITDAHDKVLAISGKTSHFTPYHSNAARSGRVLEGDNGALIFGAPIYQGGADEDHFDLFDRTNPESSAKQNVIGYVYVELSTLASKRTKYTFMLASLFIGLFGMGIASWLALKLSSDITGALLRLLQGVNQMEKGRLDVRIDVRSGGEIALLEKGFNSMAEKLQNVHHKMQSVNTDLERLVNQRTQELIEKNQDLERLSMTDSLTGIPNRLKLDQILDEEYARSLRYGVSFGIAIIDIDKFKQVNDSYGHQVGDQVLITFASILTDNIRNIDIVGRWGGEEFLLICRGSDLDGTMAAAEKLRAAIADHVFRTIGITTASFGVSAYQVGDTVVDMIARADTALYRAKENGRNRIVFEL